jgi:hypothetical protein
MVSPLQVGDFGFSEPKGPRPRYEGASLIAFRIPAKTHVLMQHQGRPTLV